MDKTLNDFQTQLSESFYSKIYLLEKILGDKHWLTSGTFKEKILISFLNQNLPKRYKAKSGFIIFPKKRIFKDKPPKDYDYLNNSSYVISKQLDIIIFDVIETLPVFEDENIVLLAPEDVKSIIEVKGTLNSRHLKDSINLLIDFKNKWTDYKSFSKELFIEAPLVPPTLYIFSWDIKKNKRGHREITGKSIRDKLVQTLKENTNSRNYDKIPRIESAFVYNQCEVTLTISADTPIPSIGYMTLRGQNVIYSDDGQLEKGGDKTLFSLLKDILANNKSLKNRFLIDTDESNRYDILPHADIGYTKAFELKVTKKLKKEIENTKPNNV
ncbi:MAG: hypothetical protein JXL97_10265 [Bacteroidales bacterium]|nr:hypothetical protein [Bacteroidales bacterium]